MSSVRRRPFRAEPSSLRATVCILPIAYHSLLRSCANRIGGFGAAATLRLAVTAVEMGECVPHDLLKRACTVAELARSLAGIVVLIGVLAVTMQVVPRD